MTKEFKKNFKNYKEEVRHLLQTNFNNRITTTELCKRFNIVPPEVRKIIHSLREEGEPIVSSRDGGYTMTDDLMEVIKMKLSLEVRAKNILQAAKGLEKFIGNREIDFTK